MSYRQSIPIYVKPYSEAQTIYPLTRYKIQQIQNIIENSPEQIIPPDWHPEGYVPQSDYDHLQQEYENLQELYQVYVRNLSFTDFQAFHGTNYFDGPIIYDFFNSQLGRRHLELPDLPENYYYHVYCQSVFYLGETRLGVLPLFTWDVKYYISDDYYVILKRTNLSNSVLNLASSKCFPVNTNKVVYSSYDVTTGSASVSYSNLTGSLQPPLTPESWNLVDFGPNDVSDPNGRSLLVSISDPDYYNFENNLDQVYFHFIAIPELKNSN